MGLVTLLPAVQEPVTLDDLKAHVRVVDERDYARLTQMGVAAREMVESILGQQLCTATLQWTEDRFINLYLYQTSLWTQQVWPWYFQSQALIGNRLPNTWYTLYTTVNPIQSCGEDGNVTEDAAGNKLGITYLDLNGVRRTLDPKMYIVDTTSTQCRIAPTFGQYWPVTQMRMNGFTVTMLAGYKKVPSTIRLAICQLAAHWFNEHEAVGHDQPYKNLYGIDQLLGTHATGRYMGGM